MAGTDSTQTGPRTPADAPAIILVAPQLGENIGTAARAMGNTGLSDLRLVNPRDGWPSDKARAAASGADWVIDGARVYDSTDAAVADLTHVFATTARSRFMMKPVLTPKTAATEIRQEAARGGKCGILFGPERTGLDNEDLVRANGLVTIPLNPGFTSLNLAMAVLLIGYEWWSAGDATPDREISGGHMPATREEFRNFMDRLTERLDETGFLREGDLAPTTVRNLTNLFQRAELSAHEINTLHGMIKYLQRTALPPEKRKKG
ncbi:MAG: RNA methyltransferase [Alphaproteobacteria bacterium]|nr:RNA methyltransferase [Alphaproteobacteria bacterium]